MLLSIPIFSACYRSISQARPFLIASPQTPTLSIPSEGQHSNLLVITSTSPSNSEAETFPAPSTPSPESTNPTPTIQTTPTLAVTLPPIQASSTAYTLTHPTSETLARFQLSRSSQFLYSNTSIDALLYPTFHTLLNYEWDISYIPGIDYNQIMPMIPNFYDHSQGRLTNTMLMDVIGDLVVSQLNEESYLLEDRGNFSLAEFSGRSYRVDIDEDSRPEWLIQVQNPDGYYLGEDSFWITLDQQVNNQYKPLENQIPWQYGFSSIENPKGVITDLTGDGLTDIAIAEQTPQAGGDNITIHIAQGSPHGFATITPSIDLEKSDLPGASTEIFEWVFPPGEEIPFLRVQTSTQSSGWPCKIETQSEYFWVGGLFQAIESEPEIPNTPSCAIAQALEEGFKSDYPAAIQLLEKALHNPSGLSNEEQIFILYRLALDQLLENQQEAAVKYLDDISKLANSGSSEIAQVLHDRIEPLLVQETLTPYRLCLAAESLSAIDTNTLWDPIGGIRSYPYVGYTQGYPTPLCDTYQFQVEYLNASFPDPQAGFPADLKADGFPFLSSLDLYSSDSESYWLLVTEDNDLNLIFDPTQISRREPDRVVSILGFENGRWERVYSSPLSESTYFNLIDLTGDRAIDFGFAQSALNPDWNPCEIDQTPYDLFVISSLEKGWLIPFSDAFCLPAGEDPDFASILVDKDHDGTIDLIANTLEEELFDLRLLAETNGPESITNNWYKMLYRTANIDYILTELTNQLLSTSDQMPIRKEIQVYLNRWQPQSELERYILAHLTYLFALQYEMTGDFKNARDHFYQVWQAYPDTVWANLASTRLDFEHKP